MTTIDRAANADTAADAAIKAKHRAMWASGDYPALAHDLIADLGPALVDACGVRPGMRVLDVAAGTGNGFWREFCDRVTVGDCLAQWWGEPGASGGLAGSEQVLKITIWGAGGVLPPECNEAPVGRG